MVSRVSKNPVKIEKDVQVTLNGQHLNLKGKNGELSLDVHPLVSICEEDGFLKFAPKNSSIESNALSGTMRALASNIVIGITSGFEKKLKLVGVGYRAVLQGRAIDFSLGFSHPVKVDLPAGITAEIPSQTEIVLKGPDKQQVSQFAANIRSIRPPEPYKGKGIRYFDERIILKEGKKK